MKIVNQFHEYGIDSHKHIDELRGHFITFILPFGLIGILIILITTCLLIKRKEKLIEWRKKIKYILLFNAPIRTYYEISLDILITAFLNMRLASPADPGDIVSYVFAVGSLVFFFSSMILLSLYTCKKRPDRWAQGATEVLMDTNKSKIGIIFTAYCFFMRRVLMAGNCVMYFKISPIG